MDKIKPIVESNALKIMQLVKYEIKMQLIM